MPESDGVSKIEEDQSTEREQSVDGERPAFPKKRKEKKKFDEEDPAFFPAHAGPEGGPYLIGSSVPAFHCTFIGLINEISRAVRTSCLAMMT